MFSANAKKDSRSFCARRWFFRLPRQSAKIAMEKNAEKSRSFAVISVM
jgi:hypothetical protein